MSEFDAATGEDSPFIEPGEYRAYYKGYQIRRNFRKLCLHLNFMVFLSEGGHADLTAYYNIHAYEDKEYFHFGKKSDLYRQICTLFGKDLIDGMNSKEIMDLFTDKFFICEVCTVKRDSKRNLLIKCLQYSKIERVIKVYKH